VSRISKLLTNYQAQLNLSWEKGLRGAEKTWFVVYEPSDERRIRANIGEFELLTIQAQKRWKHFNLTNSFEQWLSVSEYREAYFEDPEFLEMQYGEYEQYLHEQIQSEIQSCSPDTVFAISGIATLFGFILVSQLIGGLADLVQGRLLVFFPGSVEANAYRLLNARDGWNYRAVVISAR